MLNCLQGLIAKYLEPLLENKKDKEKLEIELRELRNKCALGFLLINGVFITMLFVLQSYTEELGIPWLPSVCPSNKIDPLGFTFIILFGAIILIQTLGMIIHRFGTFQHIMSITDVIAPAERDVAKITSALGNLEEPEMLRDSTDSLDSENDDDSDDDQDDRKKPSKRIGGRKASSAPVEPRADENFEKRLNAIKQHPDDESVAKITGILKIRRSTTFLKHAIGVAEPRHSAPTRRMGRFGSQTRSKSEARFDETPPHDTDGRKSVRFVDERAPSTIVGYQPGDEGVYDEVRNGSEDGDKDGPVTGTRARNPSQSVPTQPRHHEQYADSSEIVMGPASSISVDQPIDLHHQDTYQPISRPGDAGTSQSVRGGGRYAQYDVWNKPTRPEDRPSTALRSRVWQYSNNGYVDDNDT